jgi:drug/metabolite transporter (DMT)-like permease
MAAALALLTSLAYGLSNFLGPALSRDSPRFVVLIAGQVVALVVSFAIVGATGQAVPAGTVLAWAALSGVGNAWGLLSFYRAASLGPLSIVTPVASLAVLAPVATGVASGEPLGPAKLAGLALALTGVVLATRAPRDPATRQEQGDVRAAAGWALIAAMGFGLFYTVIKPASHDGVFWATGVSRVTLLSAYLIAARVSSAELRAPVGRIPVLAVPGVLLFAGTIAYAEATQRGDLSVVSVLGSLFPIVTVGLAFAFLGERLGRVQALGVIAAIAGVVLVSMR